MPLSRIFEFALPKMRLGGETRIRITFGRKRVIRSNRRGTSVYRYARTDLEGGLQPQFQP